ncbi:MAG: PKD domain-containing protein, partial [Candidatus Thiodiazotropha taylori]|nr:PKD domain-containing protein [Candidatus Thiodiazotropha taylori]MCW4257591.1 PKD domain-containing protein [Candidatus Thiodiazotropha taylori]
MNRLSFQMLSIVVLVVLSNSVAIGADFKIEKALWKAEKSLLIVKASAEIGQRLRIENAYDSTQVLKESKLRKKETLTSRVRSPEQLPCRIRVVNLTTGHEVEQDVKSSVTKRVPEGCYPTSTSEPPANKAPVADAGVDQQMQLQAGQTSMTVTLDGSGSSDPDGSVTDYIWTGSPDPADVASPSIALGEGSHKLSLVVVDDQGESSASDTVLITVEAAPVEPPPPANEVPVADAGADQSYQLLVGQSSMTVTLDGSGSMDPDGSVMNYVWEGSPNPADTASPSVTLAEGSYEFTLMVEDDQGEISVSDSVWITVNAPTTEPPATAAEAHASIVIYEGPSTCISCHEDEAVAMHGSVHYQQSGYTLNLTNDMTPFSSSGLPRAGERGDGAIGINTYCGSHLNSPRFTCAGCHVGNGRFPNSELPLDDTERQAELSNIDCLMCHQDTYKRFPSGDFEPLEIVEMGADGKPDPNLPPIVRTGSQGIPVVDSETLDFEFEPADANSTLVDLGGSPMMQDRVSAAQSVHATTRKSCLNCHAKAGGGDGTKRGDL